MKTAYTKQVALLLEILPHTLVDEQIALKGGTAINFFYRDFPRLSVDIDLAYIPLADRETSFNNLHLILSSIKKRLEDFGFTVTPSVPLDGKKEAKLFILRDDIKIKVEPNYTLRGALFPPVKKALSEKASMMFEKSLSIQCLSLPDVYGGKICAALDRGHPRDLFDIFYLLNNEGITTDIKNSFLFYLLSHNRPINEILNPNPKDISETYQKEFLEMSFEEIPLDTLLKTKRDLVTKIKNSLTDEDKQFIVSFASNAPDWSLFKESKIKDYPSIKWKLFNQSKMTDHKKKTYIEEIKNCFK